MGLQSKLVILFASLAPMVAMSASVLPPFSVTNQAVTLPDQGVLLGNDLDNVHRPGIRMDLPGQVMPGVASYEELSDGPVTALNLIMNGKVTGYVRRPGGGTADLNMSGFVAEGKNTYLRGHRTSGGQQWVYGAITDPVGQYGLINGEGALWKCPEGGSVCTRVSIPRADYFSGKNPFKGKTTYQFEQVINMHPSGDYILIMYNRQSFFNDDAEVTGAENDLPEFDSDVIDDLESSFSRVSPTRTLTPTFSASVSSDIFSTSLQPTPSSSTAPTASPTVTPTPGPNPANNVCSSGNCVVVAKSVKLKDGSFSKPEPVWSIPDIPCGVAAVYVNSEATKMVATRNCDFQKNYVFTGLDTNSPVSTVLDNSNYELWPLGISSDDKLVFSYQHKLASTAHSGLMVTSQMQSDFATDPSHSLQNMAETNNSGMNYVHQKHNLLKREAEVVGQVLRGEVQKGVSICLVEMDLASVKGSTLKAPSDCPILVPGAQSPGDIWQVSYLPSGNTAAMVSVYQEDGDGILYTGSDGSRHYMSLLSDGSIQSYFPDIDTQGVSTITGTDSKFSVTFSANVGGNNVFSHITPTPTGAIVTFDQIVTTHSNFWLSRWGFFTYPNVFWPVVTLASVIITAAVAIKTKKK